MRAIRDTNPRPLRVGLTVAVLAVFLAPLLLAPVEALAGKKSQPERWRPPRPAPDNRFMTFVTGQLQTDGVAGWRIGQLTVRFAPDTELIVQGRGGETTAPRAGREVILMGRQFGKVLLVNAGMELPPQMATTRLDSGDKQIEWSTEDPTVGQGTAPN
jgi:hypothetical protein